MSAPFGLVVLNPAGSMFNAIEADNKMLSYISQNSGLPLERVSNQNSFLTQMARNPSVVLLADNAAAARKHGWMRDRVKQYMQAGGLVILCGTFPCETRPLDMNALFKGFGKNWTSGAYYRTTHHLTDYGRSKLKPFSGVPDLCQSYSCKALNLSGAAKEDALYAPAESSVIESMVWAPTPATQTDYPALLSKTGPGHLGYIGDVNQEEGSTMLITTLVKWAQQQHAGSSNGSTDPCTATTGSGSASGAAGSSSGVASGTKEKKVSRACSNCGNEGKDLLRCGGCDKVWYCNVACQRGDWPQHKAPCKAVKIKREEKAAAAAVHT